VVSENESQILSTESERDAMKPKKLKIAIIRPGIHTLDEQFCYYLARNDCDVSLIAPEYSVATSNRINSPNFRVKLLRAFNFGKYADFPITFGLYSYLVEENFDLLQPGEDFQFSTWIAALYARKYKKRLLLIEEKYAYPRRTIHKLLFKFFEKTTCALVWNTAAKIICHSQACYQFMLERTKNKAGIKEKLTCLPVGVNTDVFFKTKVDYHLDNERLRVISVGRLIEHKDYPTMINALSYLVHQMKLDIELTIIGDGPLKKQLVALTKHHGLQEKITFIDKVVFSDLRLFYSRGNLFVLPSKCECLGAVILEAMACSLPIIVSNVGGMVDFVESNKNGYVFEVGNSKELAGKILELRNEEKRKQFGQESLRLVREEFDWNILIKKYIKMIERETLLVR